HRGAKETLGNQLGRRWRRFGLAGHASAGRLIAAPPNPAPIGFDLDLDLLRVLGVAPLKQRRAAVRTNLLGLGEFNNLWDLGQMAVVTPLGTFSRWLGLGFAGRFVVLVEFWQMVRPIVAG